MGSSSSSLRQSTKSGKKLEAEQNVKFLILGTLESGKSTLYKQLRIIFEHELDSEDSRLSYKALVNRNIAQSMSAIVKGMEAMDIPFDDPTREEDWVKVEEWGKAWEPVITAEIASTLKKLWKDGGVQASFQRSSEYYLGDESYFLNELDRITRDGYIPTTEDVMRSRVKTTGLLEWNFQYKRSNFTAVDVGGARSERRKWIHSFENVSAIVYCADIAEYHKVMAEDDETNRLDENLKLFNSIHTNRWFRDTKIILLLNKKDILEQSLQRVPFKACFEDYEGENTYTAVSEHIKQLYLKDLKREIPVYFTCAVDTEDIRRVFDAVCDAILPQ